MSGQLLLELRVLLGLGQDQVGRDVGCSGPFVCYIEAGARHAERTRAALVRYYSKSLGALSPAQLNAQLDAYEAAAVRRESTSAATALKASLAPRRARRARGAALAPARRPRAVVVSCARDALVAPRSSSAWVGRHAPHVRRESPDLRLHDSAGRFLVMEEGT